MVFHVFSLTANSFARGGGPLRRRAGFTLLELLVSMTVGVLLIIFLFQLFNSTVTAWRSGESQNDTYRDARAAMQMMVRDISQTTSALPNNAYQSPAPVGGVAPVLVIDHYAPPVSGDEINEEIYCLTNIPNNGTSNLCAVGYFCVWMPDLTSSVANTPHAYALMRQYLGSGGYLGGTVTTATPAPGLAECFYYATKSGHTVLSFTDLYQRVLPPKTPDPSVLPPMAATTQLASYIWDLQFRTPKTLQYTNSTPTPSPVYNVSPSPSPAYYSTVLPPYIEIRFKALSAGAARQLEGNTAVQRTDWNDTKATTSQIYKSLILPGTRQFVIRVPIASGSSTSTP